MGLNRSEDFTNKIAEMTREVKYLGPETIDRVPCFAYSYTLETNLGGQRYTGTGKAWVGAADGLPRQSDTEFKVSTYSQRSHIVYEYDPDIKVDARACNATRNFFRQRTRRKRSLPFPGNRDGQQRNRA